MNGCLVKMPDSIIPVIRIFLWAICLISILILSRLPVRVFRPKRRGAACLIEHLPPPMTDAGVYDELEELEKLMDEYCHFETTQPENLEKLQSLILEKVVQANLQDEVFFDEEKAF